ncbi:MAG TPA: ABC transporter substrate-binding protein [Nitrososphaerales archaeon]|nr:ABC transporter substrate-binding protein [Nitrososphaerales archaeon]
MHKRISALAVLLLLVIVSTAPAGRVVNAANSGSSNSVLRMTLVIPPNSLNFVTLSTGGSGYQIIGEEYQQMNGIHNPDGTLAPHHSIIDWTKHNANFTGWELNVALGTKWSDGSNVTSQDILTTYGPSFYLNSTFDFLGLGPEVANEYALNSTTAVYNLTAPDPLFDQKLGGSYYGGVYPASVIQSQGNSYNFFTNAKVNGLFYAANYSAGQTTMTLYRNPYFSPAPNISEIDINFVETLSLTATYIQSGSTDLAPVEWSNVPSVLKNPNVGIIDEKGFDMTTLEYNDSMYPYNVTAFRQALVYGINQSGLINQAFGGYGIPGYNGEGAISPTVTTWYNPNQTKYNFDQAKAATLLTQAGFTKGSDGLLRYPNGTTISLNLWADTDNTADSTAASYVSTALRSLGIQATVHTTTEANIIGDYNNNLQGVRSSVLLYTASTAMLPGVPFYAILPGWTYYWGPTVASHYWEWPPSVDQQYWANESAFWNATSDTARNGYLANVESINAQALPTVVLAYPDNVWAYNSQRWAGWPTHGDIDVGGGYFNNTALIDLHPATGITTTTSIATSPSIPTGTTSTSAGSATQTASSSNTAPSVSQSTTNTQTGQVITSSSSAQSQSMSYALYAVAAIVVIAIIVGAVYALRRRR